MMTNNERIRIYVWEFPVRFTHWINFLCILTLSLTGLYMSSSLTHAFATRQFVIGWVQFIHFVTAYVFLMSLIIRIYWSLAGNNYANIIQWLPLTRKRIKDLLDDIMYHLSLDIKSTSKIGHTTLGSFVFFILYIIFLMSILSGFSMYAINHEGENWRVLAGWIQDIMSIETLKSFHKLLMYIVLMFVPVHVFMSWASNFKIKNGLIRSIFNGYKFQKKGLDH